jgi:hypothetical protein
MSKIGWGFWTHFKDEKFMKCLVRYVEEQRPFGGIRRRWQNNIKVNLD